MGRFISLHDVLEPLKQALLASRDVIISSQSCGSKLQKVFTLGDGCWLPNKEFWWDTSPYVIEFFRGRPRGGRQLCFTFQVLQTLYSKRQKNPFSP